MQSAICAGDRTFHEGGGYRGTCAKAAACPCFMSAMILFIDADGCCEAGSRTRMGVAVRDLPPGVDLA
jgi:hypothetical protein